MKIWTPLEDYVYVCRQDEDEIGCSLDGARTRRANTKYTCGIKKKKSVRPPVRCGRRLWSVRWDQEDEQRAKEQDHNTTKAIQEKDTRRDNLQLMKLIGLNH